MNPNIVIVMTDQHRADLRAGCGYTLDTMPFLDQWAARGVDFRRAYTPNPCCVPARVSMLTGRYASCHKARTNHNVADALYSEDLLDVLRRAGYRTALCGKNHTYRHPEDFDFHDCNGHLGGEGEVNRTPEEAAFAQFLRNTRHMETHAPSPGGVRVQYPYRNVSAALRFLDEERGDAPFFLWLSFAEPHNPYQVPAPYFDLFPPESLPQPLAGPEALPLKEPSLAFDRAGWERVMGPDTASRILRTRSNYHGMLRLIDDQFKRFMEGLEARGLRENTVVVFLSDHGDYAGEYGLIRKGGGLCEALTRITMAWQGPGFVTGKQDTDACVSLVDVLPTICDLIGQPLPFGAQGRSLLPLLTGRACPPDEFSTAYAECGYGGLYWNERDALTLADDTAMDGGRQFVCMSSWTEAGQRRMVRKGRFKLVMDMMGTGYLYDLETDPAEIHSLWNGPAHARAQADMLASLAAAMLRADDPLPAPHRRYRVKRHPKGYWYDAAFAAADPDVETTTLDAYCRRGR